jgi:hypothetical protein
MTAHVNEQAAPWEAWPIRDGDSRQVPTVAVTLEELEHGLDAAQRAYELSGSERRAGSVDLERV